MKIRTRHHWLGIIAARSVHVCALVCALIAGPTAAVGQSATVESAVVQSADGPGAALDAAMAFNRVPAMGMAILKDDHIAALAVRGVRVIGGADPVLPDDRWHIGSDAKTMTAVVIARLVDRGVLHWNDQVQALLPDLVMQPRYAHATLAQLLSHHAGLPHDLIDDAARAALFGDDSAISLGDKRLHYLARALADPPVAKERSFQYSNTGYLLAAAIAEHATGDNWENLVQREVLTPLGMDRTRFGTTGPGEPQGHRGGKARGASETNPPFFAPAGGLVLPLGDWAKFCLDQLAGARGKGRLLSRAGYRMMQTAQGDGEYGMGWEVVSSYGGRNVPVLLHAGSDTNWFALAVLFPATGTGALVVTNAGADMGGEAAVRAALVAVESQL